jgi:hypothetical protein
MADLETWQWIDLAEIPPLGEQWWFWDYDVNNFDPYGYGVVANAHPLNWHINESDRVIGGAVEISELFWLRKGDDVQGFGNLQLNIKVRNLGDWCRYSLWVAMIPPHP